MSKPSIRECGVTKQYARRERNHSIRTPYLEGLLGSNHWRMRLQRGKDAKEQAKERTSIYTEIILDGIELAGKGEFSRKICLDLMARMAARYASENWDKTGMKFHPDLIRMPWDDEN